MSYRSQLVALHRAVTGKSLMPALELTRPARAEVFAPQARLAVYAEGYVLRLVRATLADFPGFTALMGEAEARRLAEAFVRATPSTHYDLNLYPPRFATYMHGRAESAVFAVIRLEAAIAEVFWLTESAPLQAQALMALDEEALGNARLPLRDAARLLALDHRADDWLVEQRAGSATGKPTPGQEFLLVLRHRNAVRRLALHPLEYALLAQLAAGDTLGQALERVGDGQLAAILPGFLSRWLGEGVFRA